MKRFDEQFTEDARRQDPFADRRCGDDRREAYDLDYFQEGGAERRRGVERRRPAERRDSCMRVSQWSSVCPDEDL